MAVLKKEIKSDFTVVHNKFLRDKKLSINARGLLMTMLSMSNNWNFSIKGLASILPDGERKIASTLKELEKHGYLIRKRKYEKGKIADCGAKMYLCRSRSLSDEQEHLKCSKYAKDMSDCSAHYIRTAVFKQIVISELNKLLETVHTNEDEFVHAAMENSVQSQETELKKARKLVKQYEKRVAELDKLFTRLYEDNVSGKISDERFEMLSKGYEDEQAELKVKISDLSTAIEVKEQKSADTSQFLEIVRKYTKITELTPEIMHELIERIVVHAPDKSSGHRVQQIDIYYRFNIATSTAIADQREYDKKRKAA